MIAEIVQFVVAMAGALVLAYVIGMYMALLIQGQPRPFERVLSKVEGPLFRMAGVDKDAPMTWKQYLWALLLTNALVVAFVYVILTLQGMTPDLAFNTGSSFATNTNLQHYVGETLSIVSQLGLFVALFIAPASGFAACFAFLRCFHYTNRNVGNFYVDLTRIILNILLPVAFVGAIVLMALGLPQTLSGSLTTGSLGGSPQTVSIGPVASWESIMEFGNNGGGFFGANSAHPFENPSGLTNIVEIILMMGGGFAFPFAYGELFGRGKGRALLIAILVPWLFLFGFALLSPNGPTGLETRFGSFGSMLFQMSSIFSNTGATNALLSGISRKGVVSLFVGMFIQAIPGGEGAGFMTLIINVILTIFIVGLMVGKTPEFLGYKIQPLEVKLAVIVFLLHPLMILIPSAVAFGTGQVQAILGPHVTPFGYTQVLYEYTSASANNGSDYLGTLANTPFWNISTGIVMLVGRYAPMALMLAISGQFAFKDRRQVPEPINTAGVPFILILIGVTLLLTALAFLPFLVIGPFVM
jgi:K+-transporting ATPase ATPase A chain